MGGLAMLLYSSAADWFSTLNHNSELSGYTESVERADPDEMTAALQAAYDYNAHMPQGPLRDPYTQLADPEGEEAAIAAYREMLKVSPSSAIGELNFPSVGISLPVYHGTGDEVLRKGVGHLYGSSLPVGGPSTHTVLTSHSGLVNARLFDSLHQAEVGQLFSVQVLGETHWYEVDRIDVIAPEDTQLLRIVPGHDYTTLITCTPIGINSDRLLVRGARTDPPAEAQGSTIAGDGRTAGFPWWGLWFLVGAGGSAFLLFGPPLMPRRSRDPERPHPRNGA